MGTKRTSSDVRCLVANGGKADVARAAHFGREGPEPEVRDICGYSAQHCRERREVASRNPALASGRQDTDPD